MLMAVVIAQGYCAAYFQAPCFTLLTLIYYIITENARVKMSFHESCRRALGRYLLTFPHVRRTLNEIHLSGAGIKLTEKV